VPKLNGLQLLQKIKADEKLKTVPVIILTTSSSLSDIQKAYEGYANCYITKPVDVNDFLNVVLSIENFWLSIVQLPKH
jgi:CheY-like chemotaxis protein